MSYLINLGVQSYCFRHFKDNADVAKKVREIGVDQIEICNVHADLHKPRELREIAKIYADAGVSICSFGVETFVGDPSERDFFECCAASGARHISVHFRIGSFGDAIKQTKKLSDDYGVRVGVHCHGGYSFGGQPEVLDHFIELGAPQIGLCIDTAWCLQIGPELGQPVEWARRYAGHIYGIHFKDFAFDRDGRWHDTIVGQGNLKLPEFVTALNQGGFDGMAVVEYEAEPENPVPALTRCVQAMRE